MHIYKAFGLVMRIYGIRNIDVVRGAGVTPTAISRFLLGEQNIPSDKFGDMLRFLDWEQSLFFLRLLKDDPSVITPEVVIENAEKPKKRSLKVADKAPKYEVS